MFLTFSPLWAYPIFVGAYQNTLGSVSHVKEPLEKLTHDVIEAWNLLTPTIIFQEEIPSFCFTFDMILCVTYDGQSDNFAESLARMHRERKQDGTIFFVSMISAQAMMKILQLAPTFFTSECPVFMPKDAHKILNLRLDSNVIFYEEVNQVRNELVDIFAVKGGHPITLDLAKWDMNNGIKFHLSMNRWKRRTDLNGATFVNGLYSKGLWADIIRDQS